MTTFKFARIQVTINVWNRAGASRLPRVSSFLSGTLSPSTCIVAWSRTSNSCSLFFKKQPVKLNIFRRTRRHYQVFCSMGEFITMYR